MAWELHDGKAQVGPLDEDHVIRMLLHGLPEGTVCRRVGETEWRSFRSHAPFAAALERKAATPAPVAAPPPAPARPVAPAPKRRTPWLARAAVMLPLTALLAYGATRGCESRECTEYLASAQYSAEGGYWDSVRSAVFQAKSFCGKRHADEIAALEKKLMEHDDEADAGAQVVAQIRAAEKERDAVERFPGQVEEIRAAVKVATATVAKKNLEKGAPQVKRARSLLDEYKGTSIEKGDAWRALDAQVTDLERQVKPYIDKVNAELAAAQRQLAEQAAEDRRAGVKLTRANYVASTSLEKVQQAVKYAAAGDKEGFALFVQSDPDVMMLRDGIRVVPFEHGGFAGGYVHVRVKGTLVEFWTLKEALRDP